MKAIQWVKKLGAKLVGKKAGTAAVGDHPGRPARDIQIAFLEHQEVPVVLDMAVLQLPEHWRN